MITGLQIDYHGVYLAWLNLSKGKRPSRQTLGVRQQATKFLTAQLGLSINPKNDVVVQVQAGLQFLGHLVTQDSAVVDRHTTASVLAKVDWHNVASYRSLYLVPEVKRQLDWILLEKDVDI